MTRLTQFILIISLVIITSSLCLGANKTPGDDNGADHTGFSFNPYAYTGLNGHADFRKHVGTGTAAGQQYAISEYIKGSAADLSIPEPCTVANLYQIIRNNQESLAVLLIMCHGGNNILSIEPFEKTPDGMAARDARYDAYIAGTVPGCPALTANDIYKSTNHHAHAVGIRAAFFQNHGRMNNSLTFVASCSGSTLTDDCTAAGGRVAVGFSGTCTFGNAHSSIQEFFSRMDGQEGIDKRPVAKAMVGTSHPLGSSGATDTTLAPAVKTLVAPCPIAVGDKVVYTLDTECEQAIAGNIIGTSVTIDNEIWLTKTQLEGTCTAVANDGTMYSLRLKWETVYSDQNTARLDGNIKPFLINARGPAHDDHISWRLCPTFCVADITGDQQVDISDILAVLDAWGSNNPVADVDGSGTVDIADLLLILSSWGEPCISGACCIDDYCVDGISSDECLELGGDYLGDDSVCTDEYVCTTTGACCFPPYDCYDGVTESNCLEWGGEFQGQDSACADTDCWHDAIGACCYDSGSCTNGLTDWECQFNGGYFLGPDSNCEWECPFFDPSGACCVESSNGTECIDFATEDDCASLGGDFNGMGTVCESTLCESTGACCVYDDTGSGACSIESAEDCYTSGGHYFGDGTDCFDDPCQAQSTGACCFDDGYCLDGFDSIKCEASGGIYTPDADCSTVTCVPISGACCWTDGTCSDGVYEEDCAYSGGTFYSTTTCLNAPCAPPPGCPVGEIEDCNGNCYPASWVGDDVCDDGTWGAVFNCEEFNCDGGDCLPDNCDG